MPIIRKVTEGFVIQDYDTEKKRFVNQEFVAGCDCTWENEEGDTIDFLKDPYLPFDMAQPDTMDDGK
jgi:hypothetical protein